MKYKHFTIEEREKIQEMLWQKQSLRTIAQMINRNPSSVSREIKRNKPPERDRYTPRLANERALTKRTSRGREKRLKNDTVRSYVTTHLKLGWSPEQIAGTIKKKTGETISHEAVYQYIYAQVYRGGNGTVKPRGAKTCARFFPYGGYAECTRGCANHTVFSRGHYLQLKTDQRR